MSIKENMKPWMLRITSEQAERLAILKQEGLTISIWIRKIISQNLPAIEKKMKDLSVS